MKSLIPWLEKLTGQPVPLLESRISLPEALPFVDHAIGYSQFNEILLTLGYDRVSLDFFRFVFEDAGSIKSFAKFRSGIECFRKKAMCKHGNFKYAFKTLSGLQYKEIKSEFLELEPRKLTEFTSRHNPLLKIEKISRKDTPYLGYLIQQELRDALTNATSKDELKQLKKKEFTMTNIEKMGQYNHEVYLTYDHLDVYIATSMRKPFEYWNVSRFVDRLFENALLSDLNLRWFDPTQAYCRDRIDKGLVEGLMLKRARCTIYLSQESDTFGKDSELATTLAQGKPVIAYVPRLRKYEEFNKFVNEVLEEVHPGEDRNHVVMEFLQFYYPQGPWKESTVRNWLGAPGSIEFDIVLKMIFDKARLMYDERARLLKENHPLGLQMDLETGVANGVLVVRSIPACAKVLRAILLNELEFDIEEVEGMYGGKGVVLLRERMTDSVFRVVTNDALLTNSFWNFYISKDGNEN